jgi:hypothetical protein
MLSIKMKIFNISIFLIFNSLILIGQNCTIMSKANIIVPDKLCSPLSVNWQVSYTGVNNAGSSVQIQYNWDDDDHNGGKMHIHPTIYPVCFGNSADVQFQDLTQFNCVPPNEVDVPNLYTRWIQWIYGTDNTMSGSPVTINGTFRSFPYSGPIITLPGPVTGAGIYSDLINVADDKLIGQYFQVTLRNWNYCNPCDDPEIPGIPTDSINGDHSLLML